jgi:hypothetical protein
MFAMSAVDEQFTDRCYMSLFSVLTDASTAMHRTSSLHDKQQNNPKRHEVSARVESINLIKTLHRALLTKYI